MTGPLRLWSLPWALLYLRHEVLALPGRTLALAFALFLLLFPLFSQDPYWLRVLTLTAIFALYAASWDLLSGYTGQVSLGHAFFFGISGYASAILGRELGLPPGLTIPLGALLATLAGVLVGLPSLRVRGPYLSLVTLAFPIIALGLIFLFPRFTGGELGLSGLPRLGGSRLEEYYLVVLLFLASILVLWKLSGSRVGLLFHAIREDEMAVRMVGVNTVRLKLLAFAVSAFFAGLAGGLHAHYLRVAGPDSLSLFNSIQPVIWTVFGGIATIYGPVAGTFLLFPLLEVLRLAEELRTLAFALLVLLVMRFLPQGVVRGVLDRLEEECPRCKIRNAFTRKRCRACGVELHLGRPKEVAR
ncbi:MAG: branched-chain amino acid ABC transporter permease [Thermus sp.]|uniref:branched-chain amino acid ABC transporter permease n=1 Tax=unclassified Thermus TaxID=2619321 RepID=UPI000238A3B3|nr:MULTISPECIES: branched-chain amino acid ABC transporter permease [unclassified Thermus]AEV15156.1 Inner-membrane translocator [Thermus sp. CCB_US3_UF1]MCS7219227.1 branched-chain amino acid ABC transporter permease [Thermus sp.]MCX7850464.1 branched-chain amino acid ABC transporter permease [Thermus sp.]MDW8018012.1 branched-chain amino acid ABC transporter permease [Thermus sp.]MDW8357887.1 branched-chain amino acid ABC transporter permease [Thermus sp.]